MSIFSAKYGKTLEAIELLKPTAGQLIEAASLSTPRDWLSLILLLDQIPRNIYRGSASYKVFTIFDPLALAVAQVATAKNVPSSPECKYRLTEQAFFYMPFQHSEDLEVQSVGFQKYQGLIDLVKKELPSIAEAGEQATDVELLVNNRDAAIQFGEGLASYSKKHREIIKQFGRFPHRNGPLGREPTPAETKYLSEGGETFSSKAHD